MNISKKDKRDAAKRLSKEEMPEWFKSVEVVQRPLPRSDGLLKGPLSAPRLPKSEREVNIRAAASKVFRYLADFTRHHEWAKDQLPIEQTSEGDVGVGTTFLSGTVGKPLNNKLTVVEFEPDSAIVFESDGPQGRYRHAFRMQEDKGTTLLTKSLESLRRPIALRLLMPVMRPMVRGLIAQELSKIKANVESRRG